MAEAKLTLIVVKTVIYGDCSVLDIAHTAIRMCGPEFLNKVRGEHVVDISANIDRILEDLHNEINDLQPDQSLIIILGGIHERVLHHSYFKSSNFKVTREPVCVSRIRCQLNTDIDDPINMAIARIVAKTREAYLKIVSVVENSVSKDRIIVGLVSPYMVDLIQNFRNRLHDLNCIPVNMNSAATVYKAAINDIYENSLIFEELLWALNLMLSWLECDKASIVMVVHSFDKFLEARKSRNVSLTMRDNWVRNKINLSSWGLTTIDGLCQSDALIDDGAKEIGKFYGRILLYWADNPAKFTNLVKNIFVSQKKHKIDESRVAIPSIENRDKDLYKTGRRGSGLIGSDTEEENEVVKELDRISLAKTDDVSICDAYELWEDHESDYELCEQWEESGSVSDKKEWLDRFCYRESPVDMAEAVATSGSVDEGKGVRRKFKEEEKRVSIRQMFMKEMKKKQETKDE